MSLQDSTALERAAPVLHRAGSRGGAIEVDVPWEALSEEVFEGKVVILKGAFDAAEMLRFREAVRAWSRATPEFPKGVSASRSPRSTTTV